MENKALLISVKPEFVNMYKTGKKIAELRKIEPKHKTDEVFIYNTGTKQIELKAGLIEIKKTNLSDLEQRYFKYVGIHANKSKNFLNKKKEGFLLIFSYISRVNPITYAEMIQKGITPPQTYMYLNAETFEPRK